MNSAISPPWYIDARHCETSEQISLDLTRHLPRRLAVGPAVIVAEKPAILLPVIRKRWMRIIREVERQRSSTLHVEKKRALEYEIARMRSLRFTTKINKAGADVLVMAPSDTISFLPVLSTVYIAVPLTAEQFSTLVGYSLPGSLVVVYGKWEIYLQTLSEQYRSVSQ